MNSVQLSKKKREKMMNDSRSSYCKTTTEQIVPTQLGVLAIPAHARLLLAELGAALVGRGRAQGERLDARA